MQGNEAALLKAQLERECGCVDTFVTAIETLLKYANNVLERPHDTRYRNVNANNKNFVERVGKFPAGRKLMELLGFSSHIVEGRLMIPVGMNPSAQVVADLMGNCETPAVVAADAAAAAPAPAPVPASASASAATNSRRIITPPPPEVPQPPISSSSSTSSAELPPPPPPQETTPEEAPAAPAEPTVARAEPTEVVVPAEPAEEIWACSRCTFHNVMGVQECDMCGTPRVTFADACCSPAIAVPEEPSRITVTSVREVGVGQTPCARHEMACSPLAAPTLSDANVATTPVQPVETAEVGCLANIRHVKTPNPPAVGSDAEQYLEEGLQRVRRRLAELCRRSESGGGAEVRSRTAGAAPLSDVTNHNQNISNTGRCPSSRGLSGTPLRRELAGALECGVCLSLIVYPLTTPCGHSFCRHCLAEAVAKTGKKCPTCRAPCEIDAMQYPENKVLANTAKLASANEYTARKKEADQALVRLRRAARAVPVLIGDDCPCPGSTCKLQLAEPRDVALLRHIAQNGGKFVLLPSTEGSRVRCGCVGLSCTLRRAEDLPSGRASASVNVGHRVLVVKHETAPEGHTNAEVTNHVDTNECTWESLASAHHLKRILRDFFRSQAASIQAQVERFAGPEPSLPQLPRGRREAIVKGATKYSFWVAAVLSHLRILSKRLKPSLITQSDALSRCTTLCHIIGSVLRNNEGAGAGTLPSISRTQSAPGDAAALNNNNNINADYPARYRPSRRNEIRAV